MYIGSLNILVESKKKEGKGTLLGAGIGALEKGITGATIGANTGAAIGGALGTTAGPIGTLAGTAIGVVGGMAAGGIGGAGYGAYKGYHDGHELYRDIDKRSTTADKAKSIAKYAGKAAFRTVTGYGGNQLGSHIGSKIGGAVGGIPGSLIGAGVGGAVGTIGGYKAGKTVSDAFDHGIRTISKRKKRKWDDTMVIGSLSEIINEGTLFKKITKWNKKHYHDPDAYVIGGAVGSAIPATLLAGPAAGLLGLASGGLAGYASYHLRDKNKYKKKKKTTK